MDKKKILVVDDEIDFLELLKLRLEASNYEVITAMNGREAMEKSKDSKLDAVLLDVMMPEVDGLSVLKEIRSKNSKIPVFIITAFSNEERIKIATKLNASGFIIKGQQDLMSEIKKITDVINIADKFKGKK